jgi:2-methylcitrate dehydratase
MEPTLKDNTRPNYDSELIKIADYIMDYPIISPLAFETAKLCFLDSIGCAVLAHSFQACKKLLGSWFLESSPELGARVIGSQFMCDPIKAAFDNGTLIRWLDYNDTWLAKEWGHPSDNLGGILSICDFMSRAPLAFAEKIFTVKDVLDAMIRAYEIQGILALGNSFNAVGLDHVVLVKVATAGVVTKLLGGTKDNVIDALSQAWIDGQALRTYRHAPNTGSRKSWAAGDATSRGVQLACLTMRGERGYPSALSAQLWGFNDVLFKGKPLVFAKEFGSYVMENILFKVAYPAEFHAQTAVECALQLHPQVVSRLPHIDKITIKTTEAALRIIDKKGPLYNPADRDHCLQYVVAVALIEANLTAESYEDQTAANPLIDALRAKMEVVENPDFTKDYLDLNKRSIANSITVHVSDGTTEQATCEYPLGHPQRRAEGIPLLWDKLQRNLASFYPEHQVNSLLALMKNDDELLNMPIPILMNTLVPL